MRKTSQLDLKEIPLKQGRDSHALFTKEADIVSLEVIKLTNQKKKKKKDQNFLIAEALGMNEHVQKIEIRKMR